MIASQDDRNTINKIIIRSIIVLQYITEETERIIAMYNGHKTISLCISKASSERNFEFINALNNAVTACGFRLFVYHTCSDLYWKTKCRKATRLCSL